MIREIVTDPILLSRPSREATAEDLTIAADLKDTLRAHADHCAGMAANMIGQSVRVIAVFVADQPLVLINPQIIKAEGRKYTAEEGCLSLPGTRRAQRFEKLQLRYQDEQGRIKQRTFNGFTAQVIQHELDHCEGILI